MGVGASEHLTTEPTAGWLAATAHASYIERASATLDMPGPPGPSRALARIQRPDMGMDGTSCHTTKSNFRLTPSGYG